MESSFHLNGDKRKVVDVDRDNGQKEKQTSSSKLCLSKLRDLVSIVRPAKFELEVDLFCPMQSCGMTNSTAPIKGGRGRLLMKNTPSTIELSKIAPPLASTIRVSLDRKHHISISELKQFFQLGLNPKDSLNGESGLPASNISTESDSRASHQNPPAKLPFLDGHGLESKYGKFGKLLGSGLGGSVRLLRRGSDGTTFAVKEFRERLPWETEKSYSKKVAAEYIIGSMLHHGNIIETMDLVQERSRWFEVMEYAPYDLFAIVMTGNMSGDEITCSFLQIVNGVNYLHRKGLAHRDLKLDNVMVTRFGIMKLIDFGSAVVSRCPFQKEVILASGIMGSFPYLAPEVYDERKYNAQATDIWSLAIIFCCMTLRRFPWWEPRMTDTSYNFFVSAQTTGTGLPQRSLSELKNVTIGGSIRPSDLDGDHCQHRPLTPGGAGDDQAVVGGPCRLLSCLPRQSRHIIGRMLRIDPEARASMDEILGDQWVSKAATCTQVDRKQVLHVSGHEHTLKVGSLGSNLA